MKKAREEAMKKLEQKRQQLLRETLRYVMPADKARRMCDTLLRTFDSFDGIFAAPENVLREACSMGPEAAHFLQLVTELSRVRLEERAWSLRRVTDTDSAVEVFQPHFLERKSEAVALLLLDNWGRVLYNDIFCRGSFTETPLHMRDVLQLCIEYKCCDMFLAHNHPSGTMMPSESDLLVTGRLLETMREIDVTIQDHIIFAGENRFSFLSSGLLYRLRNIYESAKITEMNDFHKLWRLISQEQAAGN